MSPPAVFPQTSHAAAPHYILSLVDAILFKVIYSTYYRDNLLGACRSALLKGKMVVSPEYHI